MSALGNTTITDDIDVSTLRCVGDYILVEVFERLKTQGGILLPTSKVTECMIGKVISAGKELPNSYKTPGYPIGILAGDVVLTVDYIGERMESPQGRYRFMHAHGVWAKVKLKDKDSFDIEELEPLFAFLLVEPIEDEITKGGIYLAQGHDSTTNVRKAKVLRAGPGTWSAKTGERLPISVKAGDQVLMLRYAGCEVVVNGKTLRLIDYCDVKSVMEE